MTDHKPMPVDGYTEQSQNSMDRTNYGKALEERYLRWLDELEEDPDIDLRAVALARTNIQQGAMWAMRSIFRPQRISVPEDAE